MQRIIDLTVEKLVSYIGQTAKVTGPLGEKVPNKEQMAEFEKIWPMEEHLPEWLELADREGVEQVNTYIRDMRGREKRSDR